MILKNIKPSLKTQKLPKKRITADKNNMLKSNALNNIFNGTKIAMSNQKKVLTTGKINNIKENSMINIPIKKILLEFEIVKNNPMKSTAIAGLAGIGLANHYNKSGAKSLGDYIDNHIGFKFNQSKPNNGSEHIINKDHLNNENLDNMA